MADIFSYAHKRDVSWVAGGFRWLKGDRCMHAGPGWVVNLGVQVCVQVEESHKHKQYIDNEGKEGELEERARVK